MIETITAEYVRQILHYDPETGVFTWRTRPRADFRTQCAFARWNKLFPDKIAGHLNIDGYWCIRVGGPHRKAHRLAWLWMTGEWPKEQIDHIDGNKSNNRFANLREATNAENSLNRRVRSDNITGIKGVGWHRARGKFYARIAADGKSISLGYFDNIENAASAYERAAKQIHGEFAHKNDVRLALTQWGIETREA